MVLLLQREVLEGLQPIKCANSSPALSRKRAIMKLGFSPRDFLLCFSKVHGFTSGFLLLFGSPLKAGFSLQRIG